MIFTFTIFITYFLFTIFMTIVFHTISKNPNRHAVFVENNRSSQETIRLPAQSEKYFSLPFSACRVVNVRGSDYYKSIK